MHKEDERGQQQVISENVGNHTPPEHAGIDAGHRKNQRRIRKKVEIEIYGTGYQEVTYKTDYAG